MLDPKLKRYNKKMNYSYAMGTEPTLDLLKYKPEKVLKVLINSTGVGREDIDGIVQLCGEKDVKYEVQDKAIEKIAVKGNTYAVGVFEKYELELDTKKNHVVLVNPMNMGNIGTIIRTMIGFGFTELALVKPAADIFDPMIVRSAMGSLFQMNFKYFDTFEEYKEEVGERNHYPFMLNGAKDMEEISFEKPYSVIFGNEGQGLDSSFKDVGQSVYIKHGSEIDSLNLSVAVSIALYKLTK